MLQYYYCGGNDGTVCAGFVLGTFSKNSKVLWFQMGLEGEGGRGTVRTYSGRTVCTVRPLCWNMRNDNSITHTHDMDTRAYEDTILSQARTNIIT